MHHNAAIDSEPVTLATRKLQFLVELKAGGVGERLKPAVLKTVRPERVSWVRIPPPPPRSVLLNPRTSCQIYISAIPLALVTSSLCVGDSWRDFSKGLRELRTFLLWRRPEAAD